MRARTLSWLYLIVMAVCPPASYGACTINNGAGDDTSTCDSGTAPGFTDNAGNNTLNITATGRVTGNVSFGAGNDLVDVNGPSAGIDGNLNQGDGANIFRLNLGSVTGSVTQGAGADVVQITGGQVGAISQGGSIDSYAQSGGTVASLAQGDGLDTFRMSGGTITGAFEDGDDAAMTGGTIGRVDMKLDNNLFDMSGGRIIGNLVTGFGNDTILISGTAFVGGNISVSGGDDQVTVSGGEVNGQILLSFGNDHFIWTGGNLHSFVLMGAGDDTALLQNLTSAQLAAAQLVDGGPGNDKLNLDNSKAGDPGLLPNWEAIQLDNGSELTLRGTTLKLGDSGSGTGTLGLDGTSKLLVGTGVIEAFTAGQLVTVSNSGVIDMTTGSSSTSDSLTIRGSYTGNGGRLALQSVLGGDGSASDKLVIDQGAIGGNTTISVTNLGGAGAATLQDGIQVVQALNGATGSAGAFTLARPVSAGAYDYRLFKGGVTAGTAEHYYLRSTVPVQTPGPVIIIPLPGPVEPPLPPNPGTEPIPIYREEVPIYAALFPAADQIVRATLGTYHERMGDQGRQQNDNRPEGWGRIYGSSSRQGFAGTVSPTLDSTLKGFQVGSDVYTTTDDRGHTQRVGLFVGHSTLKGNVQGFNGGWQDRDAGKTTLRAESLGGYWTFIGANRAYLDLVLMGSRFNGNNESDRGVKMKTRGHNITASAEVGWPFQLSQDWTVEPQAQLIVGKTRLDSQNDGISDVKYDADTSVISRLGLRLRGDYNIHGMAWQPYARANVWHASAGDNSVIYNHTTRIDTEQKSTTLEVSLGATLQVAPDVSLYGQVGYNRNLDSNTYNGREGTVGLRVAF
ncbi:autotransporter outer membrane beta-barrel domain-containing protein [Pseudomonas azotoformans]|uniref:Autotransporter outer membrane beta-barrel domain-containing protein n=1 Tax=Pseudomonas azotoformans TaxID=47878 RepID=A0A1V2JGX5_PSEAZ|nr:autotransporter outer membrane beta-barrel domain-containing protein [Pseudomonas azotoformans]OIN46137.1 autotransporter outer membrane beta-barrel domain-containing protein [Pseudomonas azotoformans]ONH44593.1 autotransporter outer membrane beta-barrel domain-containing protein [Pseudomonas azotoformans]SDN21851.1 outer membrane autotransporter barrel domain-containing protein [Pseudomonas azotoformans]